MKYQYYKCRDLSKITVLVISFTMYIYLTKQCAKAATQQVFKIFSENANESFTNNFENLDIVPDLTTSTHSDTNILCSERGAWIAFKSTDFMNDVRKTFKESVLISCDQIPLTAPFDSQSLARFKMLTSRFPSKLESIRHIGHTDLESPAISLYKFQHFGGPELYFEGHFLGLPFPVLVQSYGFTGNESWTVNSTPDFNNPNAEQNICLDGQKLKNTVIDTVTVEGAVDSMQVGGIRQGCNQRFKNLHERQEENLLILHIRNSATSLLMIDGLELRLPFPLSFTSFQIHGQQSWTIFEGTESAGSSHCLIPNHLDLKRNRQETNEQAQILHKIYSHEIENDFYSFHQQVMIGSIKRGCSQAQLQQFQYSMLSNEPRIFAPSIHHLFEIIFAVLLVLKIQGL